MSYITFVFSYKYMINLQIDFSFTFYKLFIDLEITLFFEITGH